MAEWLKLFNVAVAIIAEAERILGTKIKWTAGGASMLDALFVHRSSKDVDIFVNDPQILLVLSPRVNATAEAWATGSYTEASNAIKIFTEDGEIDFIVAPRLTDPGAIQRRIGEHDVLVETPAEILAKKVFYRAQSFTARDIFDLAFLIEHGEADILKKSDYRDKLATIQKRISRSDAALRKAFASIERTGYTANYDHCIGIIQQFIAGLPPG